MQQLYHETSEALECSGYSHGGVDFDENIFGGLDVDLELAGLVDRRIQ